MPIDKIVTNKPAVSNDIITEVIAPGPTTYKQLKFTGSQVIMKGAELNS
jgi:hypothetical protein